MTIIHQVLLEGICSVGGTVERRTYSAAYDTRRWKLCTR
jgi:hypothetical protein